MSADSGNHRTRSWIMRAQKKFQYPENQLYSKTLRTTITNELIPALHIISHNLPSKRRPSTLR